MFKRLDLTAPPAASDEGLPLANGLLGALVWGDGNPLNISIDRTDLWDLREISEYHRSDYTHDNVLALHRSGEHAAVAELLEAPYYRPAPTKIPAGRITLDLGAGGAWQSASLDLETATATCTWAKGSISVLVHAIEPAGLFRVDGVPVTPKLMVPPFGARPTKAQPPAAFDASLGNVWDLGYAAPRVEHGPGFSGFCQTGWGEFAFGVALVWRVRGAVTRGAWSIATSLDGTDPLARARAAAGHALDGDHEHVSARHTRWWTERRARTTVEVPDAVIARAYSLDMYKFDAAARAGAPPISLQGPWTVDNGRLPPWKGDYHHDLNTQMSYWPAYSGNRLDAARGFTDWLWDTRANCLDWTRRYFGVGGLNVPMTADLLNRQLGGWRQYTHSAASSSWLAHHFWLEWRYGGDRAWLADRAYPWVADVCRYVDAMTAARDNDGRRTLALSSSPEINDNRPEAWFDQPTNYDLDCFRMALTAGAAMARELDLIDEASRWDAVAAELPPRAVAVDGTLLVAPVTALTASHRHFSHLMALHPFGQVVPGRSDDERRIAEASLAQLDELGTGMWMGYSFAWFACLHARAGHGERAAEALRIYADAFLLPNGFHANGDWSNKGHSRAVFRAFTLEGNFAAVQAVHEMLLRGGDHALHLLPAIPADWRDVAYRGLLAEGGAAVDLDLVGGRLQSLTLTVHEPGEWQVSLRDRAPVRVALSAGRNELDLQTVEKLEAAR